MTQTSEFPMMFATMRMASTVVTAISAGDVILVAWPSKKKNGKNANVSILTIGKF